MMLQYWHLIAMNSFVAVTVPATLSRIDVVVLFTAVTMASRERFLHLFATENIDAHFGNFNISFYILSFSLAELSALRHIH